MSWHDSVCADMVMEKELRVLRQDHREMNVSLDLSWAFEFSKPALSGVLPPTRPHLLVVTPSLSLWGHFYIKTTSCKNLKGFGFFKIYLFYALFLPLWMCICASCLQRSQEGITYPRIGDTTVWMLGSEFVPSTRAVNALNLRTTSPAPRFRFYVYIFDSLLYMM